MVIQKVSRKIEEMYRVSEIDSEIEGPVYSQLQGIKDDVGGVASDSLAISAVESEIEGPVLSHLEFLHNQGATLNEMASAVESALDEYFNCSVASSEALYDIAYGGIYYAYGYSNEQAVVTVNSSVANIVLPSVVLADLPTGATLLNVHVGLKFALLKNTHSNTANAINGNARVSVDANAGYANTVSAIFISDNLWYCDGSQIRSGDGLWGTYDVDAEVTGNGTYYVRFESVVVDVNSLQLRDVNTLLRVAYRV